MSEIAIPSGNIKSQAEYAYLQIFDANDQLQRKTLLKHILTESRTAMLFLLHCAQNTNEVSLAFLKIADDPQKCSEIMKKRLDSLSPIQREIALNTVLTNSEIAWDTAWNSKLTLDEKKLVYETHRNEYLNIKTIDNYWAQWGLFGDLMDTNDIEEFINILCDNESDDAIYMSESLLMYGKNLTQDQRDRLDSRMLASTLKG